MSSTFTSPFDLDAHVSLDKRASSTSFELSELSNAITYDDSVEREITCIIVRDTICSFSEEIRSVANKHEYEMNASGGEAEQKGNSSEKPVLRDVSM